MALPMLVGGADCGPSNALQSLTKQFDRERGIQQDHFGAGRAESSREAFRSHQPISPDLQREAAQFFSGTSSPAPQLSSVKPFDMSLLRASLPSSALQAPHRPFRGQEGSPSAWASDFMQQLPASSRPAPQTLAQNETAAHDGRALRPSFSDVPQGGVQWSHPVQDYRTGRMSSFAPPLSSSRLTPALHTDQIPWDKEFASRESELLSQEAELTQSSSAPVQDGGDDELARTAGLLVEAIKGEQNPKFKNSQFMGLMVQLRDHAVVVEGNQMVEKDAAADSAWANDFRDDVKGKGKGKAVEPSFPVPSQAIDTPGMAAVPPPSLRGQVFRPVSDQNFADVAQLEGFQDNEVDRYFRDENREFIDYWDAHHLKESPLATGESPDSSAWSKMQADRETLESNSFGLAEFYAFQANNPYLLGDSSQTRHHSLHSPGPQSLSFYESILELEAAVQREPQNAQSWFHLGVKQQESERERKALQALERAVELDPTHLQTWVALAVSHANDNNRLGAHNAIREWISRNKKYTDAVSVYRSQHPGSPAATTFELCNNLIDCLIAMIRSDDSGEVDADIQIVLAVLLNSNEDFDRAQDCFRAALAARPHDWLLYNRVGATLANSGHADKALEYYYRALELNPSYIRARFNLGISCINLHRYEEAAEHISDALILQDSEIAYNANGQRDRRGVTSSALWDSLKTACLHMQRLDLAGLCERQDLEGFRGSFQLGVVAAEG